MIRFRKERRSYVLLSVLSLILISGTSPDDAGKTKEDGYFVVAPRIPDLLYFAGEKVPLYIPDVKERLDRELVINTFYHSNTFQCLKRAHRYFPVIVPILKSKGIPEDFKYLAVVESDLQDRVSPSGATGYWQFLTETGKKFGLEINDEVDERYDITKSTIAACDYLNMAYGIFKNWTLCAASYNNGMENIRNNMNRQKAGSYYDLYLYPETSRYVFRILAIREIMENPKKYGFFIEPSQLYYPIPTHKVKTDTTINDLVDFALKNKTTYKDLKNLNGWLRNSSLKNKSRKVYEIELPIVSLKDSLL